VLPCAIREVPQNLEVQHPTLLRTRPVRGLGDPSRSDVGCLAELLPQRYSSCSPLRRIVRRGVAVSTPSSLASAFQANGLTEHSPTAWGCGTTFALPTEDLRLDRPPPPVSGPFCIYPCLRYFPVAVFRHPPSCLPVTTKALRSATASHLRRWSRAGKTG
jgi:hypothetical protein